jgi:hypothetical protein
LRRGRAEMDERRELREYEVVVSNCLSIQASGR